jgi:hypothetical protein
LFPDEIVANGGIVNTTVFATSSRDDRVDRSLNMVFVVGLVRDFSVSSVESIPIDEYEALRLTAVVENADYEPSTANVVFKANGATFWSNATTLMPGTNRITCEMNVEGKNSMAVEVLIDPANQIRKRTKATIIFQRALQ